MSNELFVTEANGTSPPPTHASENPPDNQNALASPNPPIQDSDPENNKDAPQPPKQQNDDGVLNESVNNRTDQLLPQPVKSTNQNNSVGSNKNQSQNQNNNRNKIQPQKNESEKTENENENDVISILNFQEKCGDDIPTFTEDATLKAMYKLVIEPEMLRKPTDAEFVEFKDFPDVKKQVESLLNSRRQNLIDQITAEREKILNRMKSRDINNSSTNSNEPQWMAETVRVKKEAMRRIQNTQKKEIESLIVSELLREKAQRKDEEDRIRRTEKQQQYEAEVKKKQAEEAEKKRIKDEQLLKRIAEKEAELLEQKKKQEADIIRNQEILAQKNAEKLKQLAEADKQRQLKAARQRETIEKQRKEEQKAIEQRMKEQEERERRNLFLREKQIKTLKETNLMKFMKQQQRFAVSQQQDREKMERKRKEMEQKEKDSKLRMDAFLMNRDKQAKRQQARSAMLLDRHRNAADELQRQKEEKIKEMVFKDNKDQERRDAIMNEKLEKMKKERQEEMEKQKRLQEMTEQQKEEMNKRREEALKKWNEEEEKANKAKMMHEEEIKKKAAFQALRDKIQTENAERQKKMKEIDQEERGAVTQDRQNRAAMYVQTKQEVALKKREEMTKLDFKKAEILTNFREGINKGGKIDIDKLAKQYNIDIDYLRSKVESSDIQ